MDSYILINILSLIFSCLGLIFAVIFLTILCTRIRPLNTNISLVLICNTYLTEITSSIMEIDSCSRTIAAILNPSISDQGVYCRIRAYFLYVFISNVIYSFVVQAFFQLFRVVFYRKRELRTCQAFIIAIIIQWIFVCSIYLVFFPLNDFVYVSSEYRCLISYSNYRGSIMIFLFAYLIPTNLLFTIYFFILRYLRQTNQAMENHQFSRKRDLTVLKRIMLFLIVLQLFSIPLAVIWLIYIITGYLVSLVYQLQGLTTSISQVFMTIFITFGTPQMQEILKWRRRQQVHPIVRIRIQPNGIMEKIRMQRF